MPTPPRYLVIQLARLGDLLQTKRLLLSLCSQSELHLCVDNSLLLFARKLYPFAHVHGISAHAQNITPGQMLRDNRVAFGQLSELNFTQIFNLNYSGMNFALAGLFEPELVRGYRNNKGQWERSLWAKLAMRWTAARRSAPLNLGDFWGLMADRPVEGYLVNPPAGRRRPTNAGKNKIGIVLSGRESRRSLPPAQLGAVLKAVFEGQQGPNFVLLGSKAEQPLARQLIRHFTKPMLDRTEDLSGRTSLTDLFEVVDSCNQLISPDTGLMHLAAHLGVPVQAFFLSSAWCWETGPYGQGHLIWQATTSCSPCLESAPCTHLSEQTEQNTPAKPGSSFKAAQPECLAPFTNPAFLAHLSGRYHKDWPENLCGLVSGFDSVGVSYTPVDGDLPLREERMILRTLIGEHLGLFSPASDGWLAANPKTQALAQSLFQESDWVLEQF